MSVLRKTLPLFVAAVMAMQPVMACCAETGSEQLANAASVQQADSSQAQAARSHCGEPTPLPPAEHQCDCGDGCASMQAVTPADLAKPLSAPAGDWQPAAIVTRLPAPPPAAGGFNAQGLPPPSAAPPARPTLVTLKRLLLI